MLSKVIANSLGVLATMVVLPGVVAYALSAAVTRTPWNLLGFLAAMGVIFLSHFFFLSLSLMLGTLFNSRGPVIGITLALLLMQQNLVGWLPFLRYVLPLKLILPLGEQLDAVAPCLLVGSHNYSPTLIVVIALGVATVLMYNAKSNANDKSDKLETQKATLEAQTTAALNA